MNDVQLTLDTKERDFLVNLLESVLKEKRIEEHRTRTISFRDYVLQQEAAIVELLRKLGKPAE
jgi:hypothetical protein